MEENIGKIYETEEYGKFKFLKGNRKIKRNLGLEQSIRKNGILIPIAVNEKFELLDGQSRYEIAKKYGKKILYSINEGFNMSEVIDLNSTKKAWKFDDYINKFVVDGNQEYQKLSELIEKYPKIPTSSLAAAAQGFLLVTVYSSQRVREGKFTFYNYPHFCTFLECYSQFIKRTHLKSGQGIFLGYLNLYTIKKFKQERLIKGMNKTDEFDWINGNVNLDRIIEALLKAHNYSLNVESENSQGIKSEFSNNEKLIILDERDLLIIKPKRKEA